MAGATVEGVVAGATVVAVGAGATVVATVVSVAAVCIGTDSCQFPDQLLPVPCQA